MTLMGSCSLYLQPSIAAEEVAFNTFKSCTWRCKFKRKLKVIGFLGFQITGVSFLVISLLIV